MQGQALPFKMPSMEWRLVCTTSRSDHTNDEASIWRPYGAPRYCSLGDVLRKGREPPTHPVAMYLGNQHSKGREASPFVHPLHYQLVWRDFSGTGITIWRGQPPEGYRTVGCVASKGLNPPPNSAMACIRMVRQQFVAVCEPCSMIRNLEDVLTLLLTMLRCSQCSAAGSRHAGRMLEHSNMAVQQLR